MCYNTLANVPVSNMPMFSVQLAWLYVITPFHSPLYILIVTTRNYCTLSFILVNLHFYNMYKFILPFMFSYANPYLYNLCFLTTVPNWVTIICLFQVWYSIPQPSVLEYIIKICWSWLPRLVACQGSHALVKLFYINNFGKFAMIWFYRVFSIFILVKHVSFLINLNWKTMWFIFWYFLSDL